MGNNSVKLFYSSKSLSWFYFSCLLLIVLPPQIKSCKLKAEGLVLLSATRCQCFSYAIRQIKKVFCGLKPA